MAMVSVIVPVYNAGKKIRDCIKSILRQSYRDIELIIIDDCSTDSTPEIIAKFSDPRIRCLKNDQNQGVEISRLRGLKAARGEYIMFVDADDWLLHRDVISHMVSKIEETRADYVEVGCQRHYNRFLHRKGAQGITGIIEQPRLFDEYYISYFGYNKISINIWGKLYRRDSLTPVEPLGLKMGEDLYFKLINFPRFKKICILPEIGYAYRVGGVTSHYNPRLYPDLEKLFLKKLDLIAQYNYQKAAFYAWSEIKNVFRSEIVQLIFFRAPNSDPVHNSETQNKGQASKQQIITRIRDLCSRPYWAEYRTHVPEPDAFAQLILAKDPEAIYAHCLPLARQATRSRRLKSLLYH